MKVIGIMTANFRFFYEIVQILKEHRVPFVTLDFDEDVPINVGVVITTREEKQNVRFHRVVAENSPAMAYKLAHGQLKGREKVDTMVVGIDPGRRPGLAIIGDGRVLFAETVGSPEAVADEVERFSRGVARETMTLIA